MIKYFIVSHGKLSKGILDSIKMIAGEVKNIAALQLELGGNPKNLASEIEEEIKSDKNNEFVIFTDLKGGSVHNAMISLCVYDNVNIISGFNLGMILDAVFIDNSDSISKMTQELINVGKDNIELFNKVIVENLLDKGGDK